MSAGSKTNRWRKSPQWHNDVGVWVSLSSACASLHNSFFHRKSFSCCHSTTEFRHLRIMHDRKKNDTTDGCLPGMSRDSRSKGALLGYLHSFRLKRLLRSMLKQRHNIWITPLSVRSMKARRSKSGDLNKVFFDRLSLKSLLSALYDHE